MRVLLVFVFAIICNGHQAGQFISVKEKHELLESALTTKGQGNYALPLLSSSVPFSEFLSDEIWESKALKDLFSVDDIFWLKKQTEYNDFHWKQTHFQNLKVVVNNKFLFFKRRMLSQASMPIFSSDGSLAILYHRNFSKNSFSESLDVFYNDGQKWIFKKNIFSSIS